MSEARLLAIILLAVLVVHTVAPAPANAASCLDHSHSASGTGIGNKAAKMARNRWVAYVRADDGAKWADLKNARNAHMSCRMKDPSAGLKVCTFEATPCGG